MFDFLSMAGNYEFRKVARYEDDNLVVSTCMVTDSDQPFETAVAHPAYNNGELIVVETYESKRKAEKGHEKWIKKMTFKKLPKKLIDVSMATIAKNCDLLHDDKNWRIYKKSEEIIRRK